MTSIWTKTVQMPTFDALHGELQTDVLVIGGGIAGILTAWACREAGIPCVLVEAKRLCSGMTANTTAKITSQHGLIYSRLLRVFGPEVARGYWAANEEAIRHYERLSRDFPCDYETRDNYIYTRSALAPLERELEALHRLHIPADFTTALELPMETAGAVRFRRQAQFHPLKLLTALCRELTIYEQTMVRSFDGTYVQTEHGRIRAKHVVVATHFPMLNKHGSYFIKLHQSRSYVLALEHARPVSGMYLDAAEEGLSFRTANGFLLLGGGAHRTGKPSSGWKPLEAFARQFYPDSREAARWAAQDCMTLDGMPYIGRYSSRTHQLYVATGFQKWGMTSSMVAAYLLCDMIQGKRSPYADIFSPSRSMLRPQLLDNMLESAKNLLTFSRPRCPHLGCALQWNRQEHSWDCPCHGSRFTAEGALLDNPATGNLKKKPLRR